MDRSRSIHGFTLIELLIVVAIIAILAAIAVPNFLEAQTRSKVTRFKADSRSMATALEAYFVDNNTYCSDASPAYHQLTTPVSYMTSIPIDPFGENLTMTGSRITNRPYEIGTGHTAVYLEEPDKKNCWIIVGAGPDHLDSSGSIKFFPWPPNNGPAFTPYDPTNGTVSRGDLYRVGGERLPESHNLLESFR